MKYPKILRFILRDRFSKFQEIENYRCYNSFYRLLAHRDCGFRIEPSFNHHSKKVRHIKLVKQGFDYDNNILSHIEDLRC